MEPVTHCSYCQTDWRKGATHCYHCSRRHKDLTSKLILLRVLGFGSVILGIGLFFGERYANANVSTFSQSDIETLKSVDQFAMYGLIAAVIYFFYVDSEYVKLRKRF